MEVPSKRQQFNALVQAQTTVISLLPYLMGLVFTAYYYRNINVIDTVLLMIAVVSFHLAVNGHNQYTDYRRFESTGNAHSFNNIIRKFKIPMSWARTNIIGLVVLSAAIGLYLTVKTGWILLLIGVASFLVGYFYSGGHHPILKTPFGEPASGITMGYNIVLLVIFINIYNLTHFDPFFWAKGLVVAGPAIFTISNVMLGNNICDQEEDEKVGRHTLVHYIGRSGGLKVLISSYIASFVFILLGVALRLLPVWDLLVLLMIIPVWSRTKIFVQHPDKATTFPNILIDLQLILISEIVVTFVALLLQ